jgi:hypothetical protein
MLQKHSMHPYARTFRSAGPPIQVLILLAKHVIRALSSPVTMRPYLLSLTARSPTSLPPVHTHSNPIQVYISDHSSRGTTIRRGPTDLHLHNKSHQLLHGDTLILGREITHEGLVGESFESSTDPRRLFRAISPDKSRFSFAPAPAAIREWFVKLTLLF